MNIEFHYYIVHLIAAKAGFRGETLRKLAHSSQYVDHNLERYKVEYRKRTRGFRGRYYRNMVTQTLHPFDSHKKQLSIYPLFHFIPGDPEAPTAERKDERIRPFNTTPNSLNAQKILDTMLATQNPYLIGIALHAYADTWSHQNFVGYDDLFNGFDGRFVSRGHLLKGHDPDKVNKNWEDSRLKNIPGVSPQAVNNTERFLDAAEHIFKKLKTYLMSETSQSELDAESQALRNDLLGTMKEERRIDGYIKLSDQYGEKPIPYDKERDVWFDACVKKSESVKRRFNQMRRVTTYRFLSGFRQSDWFLFQEAARYYAATTRSILEETLDFKKDTNMRRLESL